MDPMEREAGAEKERRVQQAAARRACALVETMVAALPMDDDRRQAERSWQLLEKELRPQTP